MQARGPARRRPRDRRAGALLRRDRPGRRCRPSGRRLVGDRRASCAAPARSSTTEHPTAARARWRRYGDGRLAAARAPGSCRRPTVWCSWYRYFEEVTAADVAGEPARPRRARPPRRRGAGRRRVEPRPRRGAAARGPVRVAGRRGGRGRATSGRRAGIWLAPFLVGDEHHAGPRAPRLAGRAGRPQLGPGPGRPRPDPPRRPRTCCADVLRRLVDLGVDYLKLDFLYAGAVPGRRREDVDRGRGLPRRGSALVRDVVGPDVYLVGLRRAAPAERRPRRRHAGLARHLPRGRRGRLGRAARADAAGRAGLAAGPALGQRPRLRGGPAVVRRSASGGPEAARSLRRAARRSRTGSPTSTTWGLATVRDAAGRAAARPRPWRPTVIAEAAALAQAEGCAVTDA